MDTLQNCPISGARGTVRRVRNGAEIAASYTSYHDASVPAALLEKYFTETVREYQCDESGLRWYSPAHLGESDFYEWLATVFPWYYSNNPTWDKLTALSLLAQSGSRGFVEVGSGGGVFLQLARERGIWGIGTEINAQAIQSCQEQGLQVYYPDKTPADLPPIDTLVSLQSLEHLLDPVEYLRAAVEKFPVQRMIIAVPDFEALLGRTIDPLAWPPHHYTAWSEKALVHLGHRFGFRLDTVRRDRLTYTEYCGAAALERALPGSQVIQLSRLGYLGKAAFHALRSMGVPWAAHRHSIVVVLTRES